ncbi:MAG: DUF1036 domain-containing protein [Parvularculaceae bacterium]|nr:DUF1036 domain-containing protein [Parvularculaceae bacterium]
MRSILLFLLSAIGASLALTGAANAKYSLCNKTSYALSAAIGYVDGDRLATRGWWRLRPGQCKVVLTEPTNPGRYFVYAEAVLGHKGPLRSWSGDTPLCVENNGFFNLRNQEVCRDEPTRQRGFFDVEVTPAAGGNWQTDFAEAANYTVYSAEVAGVQRLLNDLGLAKVRIDGSLGRETQRLLASYRKEKSIGEGPVIDDATIDAMIEEANARESKLGLFFCNKADQAVWSALAEPKGENQYESRGWWKLEPGDCAKVIKGGLSLNHYYVYGVIEDQRGERRLAGGDKSFCINAVRFAASTETTCADQELEEAIFKKVDIGGSTSATYDFTADAFVAPPSEAPAQQ